MSEDYYDVNAAEFFASTSSLDMEHLYKPFLALVPPAGLILDAGCGSGRDTKAFKQKGYSVVAIDSSTEMCRLASEFTGQTVEKCRFQDLQHREHFDGIWACASLLHIPKAELPDVLRTLSVALKPGSPFFMSFKLGACEEFRHGRHFINFTESGLREQLSQIIGLTTASIWITTDARPGRSNEPWLNALCKRSG